MITTQYKLLFISMSMVLSLITITKVVSTRESFEQWMIEYELGYSNNEEKEYRFSIFENNTKYIESFNNAANITYTLGVNQFADLTYDEFVATYTGAKIASIPNISSNSFEYENLTNQISPSLDPPSIDWRVGGAVTPVKNQGKCGSCWVFAPVAAIESVTKIYRTGKLVSFSEQQIIDCDKDPRDHGCRGGVVTTAYEYASKNGLVTEEQYPYKAIDQSCNTTLLTSPMPVNTGFGWVPHNDERALQNAVANQPTVVKIETSRDFMLYKQGVFTGSCGTNLNHALLAVGYGATETGTKFWILKNSHGTRYGENGYIRMLKDVEAKEGLCGIAMQATYPVLVHA